MKFNITFYIIVSLFFATPKKVSAQDYFNKPQNTVDFFQTLINTHFDNFYKIDSSTYIDFCKTNNLNSSNFKNKKNYFAIKILHELFTSQNPINCSKGQILDIPYFWHWVNPNPRHKIYSTINNQLLVKTKPTKDFEKYNSFADIDRTPYLFLSDLLKDKPLYFTTTCDTFSTFGWCSEREMAFVALTKLLNIKGKVVAENNHSWSEFIIPMTKLDNTTLNFIASVDNTYNKVYWEVIKNKDVAKWSLYLGNSNLAKWYNQKANSPTELNKIKSISIGSKRQKDIDEKVRNYLSILLKR